MKTLLKAGILVLLACYFSACAKDDGSSSADNIPVEPANPGGYIACNHEKVIGPGMNFSSIGDNAALFDEDNYSPAYSGPVAPGDRRIVEIDFGCLYDFRIFQITNFTDNTWQFGRVEIYSAPNFGGPWALRASFGQANTVEEESGHWFRYNPAPIRMQYVRYVFVNDTASPKEFVVTDIENSADYVSGN